MTEETLFCEALARTVPAERAAYLAAACGNDSFLRGRIEALIASHEQRGFLDRPAIEPPDQLQTLEQPHGAILHSSPPATSPPIETVGTRIGRYKLLQQIGEGGFGNVFLAEQDDSVRRRVALKIIKLGMDTKSVIARFEAERQALAVMDHPNIAKVFDAGATDAGRPYFVMELVKGEPITEHADHNHLSIPQRLELFAQVCHAVQHAHQKGIIHRDIKPRNVLVHTQDGLPFAKVIDFGIAKAISTPLTDKTLCTEFKQLIGTPQYMSPEQADGSLDIDTRTDIYSLGVLLYELLTGTTPFGAAKLRSAAYDEMRRIIREDEPPKPSTRLRESAETLASVAALRHSEPKKMDSIVRGDLDWIVMKALEKTRERRYATPGELAADVQRYLNNQPVEASPPSAAYRIRKFVRRNRPQVVAAAVVVLALVGGIAGTTWQALRATHAETDALTEKAVALAAKEEVLGQADHKRRLLYSADVHLESEVWQSEDGTALQCDDLLRAHLPEPGQPDLRDFCWRYQWGLMQRGLEMHLPPARRTAGFTSDNRIVTLDEKGIVNSWRIGERSQPQSLKLLDADSIHSTLSASGEVAAVNDTAGSIRIFDTRTGLSKGLIRAPSALTAIGLSADGRHLAGVGQDQHARIWEVAGVKELYDYPVSNLSFHHIDLSLDGKMLLMSGVKASDDPAVFLCQAGEPIPIELPIKHDTGFGRTQAALSPNEKLAASGHCGDHVDMFDMTTHKLLQSLRTPTAPLRVAFSPDSSRLAVGEETGLVTLWDLATQQIVGVFKGHRARIEALVFNSDGRKLISLDRDGATRCWNLDNPEEPRAIQNGDGEIYALSYSPDGRYMVEAVGDHISLYDLRSGDKPQLLAASGSSTVLFSPDGQTIAAGVEGGVSLWHAGTAKRSYTLLKSPDHVGSLAFSPDGHWLAAGFGEKYDFGEDRPGKVVLFDVKNRKEQWRYATSTWVSAVSFSRDGKLLAAAGHDGTITLWDVATWDRVGLWKAPAVAEYASILFLPGDRELAVGCSSGAIDIWDVGSGTLGRSLRGHGDGVPVMALSPDGRTLASGSWDHSIKLWDVGTFRELLTLHGHTSWVYALTFSPDGNTLASGGVDGLLRLWEAPSMEVVGAELAIPQGK